MKNYLILFLTILSFEAISQCAIPKTIPYIENFNAGSGLNNLPLCSKNETEQGGTGRWIGYPNVNGGKLYTDFGVVFTRVSMWWITPGILIQSGKSYKLSFKYKGLGSGSVNPNIICRYGTCDSSICLINAIGGVSISDQVEHTFTASFMSNFSDTIFLSLYYRADPIEGYPSEVSEVSLVENIPTPVTISALTAQTQFSKTNLYFQTYTEQNNKGFYVEQSINGLPFTSLGFIPSKAANGNSILPLSYQYRVNGIAPAQYRLQQQDFNGAISYSNIVSVTGKAKGFGVTVLPNPVINNLQASIYSPAAYKGMVQIVSSTGRQVHSQAVNLPAGFSSLSILANNWPAGSYFIKVNGVVTRFVK